MAQSGFMLSDEGRTIVALNDSGTTAITAGDIVYSAANDDALGATAAEARNDYSAGDIKVKSMLLSATGYKTVIGIAMEDIPADGYGTIAMEGVWIHAVNSNTEAGDKICGDAATANKIDTIADSTTTFAAAVVNRHKWMIGKTLTGGSADGKYIVWKLTL